MNLIERVLRRLRPVDEFVDVNLRREYAEKYGVEIGLYSYGCFDFRRIGRNTKIGRYCSFAPTSYVFRRNHGLSFIGLTPYFYNKSLGVVTSDTIENEELHVADDVWVGHNSVILPSVRFLGRGAVVGAGAVVTKDVPPYAIVVGNPARVIKYRFSPEVIDAIEASNWWLLSPMELRKLVQNHPQLVFSPATFPNLAEHLASMEFEN